MKRLERKYAVLPVLIVLMSLLVCCSDQGSTGSAGENETAAKGKLFIIGGGDRPAPMIKNLIEIAGVDSAGYIVILPMSSSAPDTSAYYAKKQFTEQGIDNIHTFNLQSEQQMKPSVMDSVVDAGLIYMTGGNQNRFMEIVRDTELERQIRAAYQQGSVIAGTSAGAAVMSELMITGDERKHPEYTGNFRTIEANNIILESGLGLISQAIIDQHFIKRMRMNRLISACLEHPGKVGVGIDEATAILVEGNRAKVYGEGQVMVLRTMNQEVIIKEGLLGGQFSTAIYLPGQQFSIQPSKSKGAG